jgi:hypothetical protein
MGLQVNVMGAVPPKGNDLPEVVPMRALCCLACSAQVRLQVVYSKALVV